MVIGQGVFSTETRNQPGSWRPLYIPLVAAIKIAFVWTTAGMGTAVTRQRAAVAEPFATTGMLADMWSLASVSSNVNIERRALHVRVMSSSEVTHLNESFITSWPVASEGSTI